MDGGAWQNSGATVSGLSVGSHTVAFKTVSGWTTPGNQSVTINANQTTTATGNYNSADSNDQIGEADYQGAPMPSTPLVMNYGNIDNGLGVDMFSFDVTAGQRLGFDVARRNASSLDSYLRLFNAAGTQLAFSDDDPAPGETTSQESYLEYAFASGGRYYAGVSGYNNSAYDAITGNGDTTGSMGEYSLTIGNVTPQTGSLQVNLAPAGAVSAGAQWQVDSGAWQNSGATVSGLSVGSHTVVFKAVSGWTTPGNQTVTINVNQTTVATGTYVAIPSCQATLLSPAVGATEVAPPSFRWSFSGICGNKVYITTNPVPEHIVVLSNAFASAMNTLTITEGRWRDVASRSGAPRSQYYWAVGNVDTQQPDPPLYAAWQPFSVIWKRLTELGLSNGICRFVLNGPVGSNYVVQVSSNLVDWTAISTNTIPAGGSGPITDSVPPGQPRRFYRALLKAATLVVPHVLQGPITNPANGHRYYLLGQNTWTGAEAEAVALGGHLATVNDAAENAWITTTFSAPYYYLWIGLNDSAQEGYFVWSSGQANPYANWYPGEPNNSGNEDFVLIYNFDSGQWQWNDMGDAATFPADNPTFPIYGVVEVP